MATILHHPEVALSRKLVELVSVQRPSSDIVDVSTTSPDDPCLATWLAAFPLSCRELMDRQSSLYFALRLDDPKWSELDVFRAGLENPSLFSCPVVLTGRAVYRGTTAFDVIARGPSVSEPGDRPTSSPHVTGNDNVPAERRVGSS